MRRASGVRALALVVIPGVAAAEDDDQVVVGTDVALTGGAVVPNVKTGGALWYNAGRRGTARQPIRHLLIVGVLVSLLDVKAGTLLILVVPLIFFTNIVRLGAPSPTDSASGDPND